VSLPGPTSGPGVAAYLGLVLVVALILYLVISGVGSHVHGGVGGLRAGLGLG